MRYILLLISIFCFLPFLSHSQSFQEYIDYVNGLANPVDQQNSVDSLMNELEPTGLPLIEGSNQAHFLYQGSESSVSVPGDFNFWDPGASPMTKLADTDLWYRSYDFESNARLDYKLVVNGSSWILDPLNPNTVLGGFGPNSELAMPDYVQPWEIEEYPGVPLGSISQSSIYSDNTGKTYQYKVYLPAEYEDNPNRHYPTIYLHDGFEYVDLASSAHILDNLIDEELITPLIAVFVHPTNRNEEYAFSQRDAYRLFFAEELVPVIDQQYRTRPEAEYRGVIGTSFGGNISALISYNHPDVFGKAGLHSAAFWPNNDEALDLLNDNPAVAVKYAFVWGTYEGNLSTSLEGLMPVMLDKGYDLYYNSYPEGHSWGLWRATLDEMLIFLFPPGQTIATTEVPEVSWSLSPNPSTKFVQIELPSSLLDKTIRYDILTLNGQLVATGLFDQTSNIDLTILNSSGVYLLRLMIDDQNLGTQKLIFQAK